MQCRTSYSRGASSQPQSPNSRLAHLTTRDNSAEIQAHSFFHKSELFLTSNQWREQSPLSSAFLQPPPHLISVFHLSHLFSPSSSWSSEHNVFLFWFIQFYPHPTPQTKSRHLQRAPGPPERPRPSLKAPSTCHLFSHHFGNPVPRSLARTLPYSLFKTAISEPAISARKKPTPTSYSTCTLFLTENKM